MDTTDIKTTGRRIMNELMGDGYVEKKDQNRNSFNDVIQDYSEEVCFGRVWARDGIDRKTRSIINLSVLTALGRPAQLAHHVEGAINNGATVAEIKEVLLQTAVYAACPRPVRPSRSPKASCRPAATSTDRTFHHTDRPSWRPREGGRPT